MDRKPSTTLKWPRYCGACFRRPLVDREAMSGMFAAAREAFGKERMGLTDVKGGRAWFQVTGDPTPYSIALSERELALFHLEEVKRER